MSHLQTCHVLFNPPLCHTSRHVMFYSTYFSFIARYFSRRIMYLIVMNQNSNRHADGRTLNKRGAILNPSLFAFLSQGNPSAKNYAFRWAALIFLGNRLCHSALLLGRGELFENILNASGYSNKQAYTF